MLKDRQPTFHAPDPRDEQDLLTIYARERAPEERFGEFVLRAGCCTD